MATATASPPRCTETKKNGEPCTAYATGSGKCAGHSRLGAISDPQANGRKGAAARLETLEERQKAAEEATNSTKEAVNLAVERLKLKVVGAFEAAIDTGSLEDLRRAQASELLLSRVYGRPTERVETKADLPPVLAELERFTPEERRALLAGLASGKRLRVVDGPEEKAQAS